MKLKIPVWGLAVFLFFFLPAMPCGADGPALTDAQRLQALINEAPDGERTEMSSSAVRSAITVTETITVPSGKNIVIDNHLTSSSVPYLIRGEGFTGPLIRVEDGGSLSLAAVAVDGGSQLDVPLTALSSLVYVEGGGIFTLMDNSGLRSNRNINDKAPEEMDFSSKQESPGGGIYVEAGGTVNIGPTSSSYRQAVESCSALSGGGVYVADGGACCMSGSGVKNCTALEDGGAFYLEGGLFESFVNVINGGGSVTECSAGRNGGAFYLEKGTLILGKPSVSNCTAGEKGGGIYARSGSILNGGDAYVRGCSAAAEGGGIYLSSGASLDNRAMPLKKTNPLLEITGCNTERGSGGGMFVEPGAQVLLANRLLILRNYSGGRRTALGYEAGSGRDANIFLSAEGCLSVPGPITGFQPPCAGITCGDNVRYFGQVDDGVPDWEVLDYLFSDTPGVSVSRDEDGRLSFEAASWADKAVSEWVEEQYAAGGEIHLTVPAHLAALIDMVNGGRDLQGRTVVLDSPLNLAAAEWVPIGTREHSFRGSFLGRNQRITGLFLKSDLPYAGLFGYVEGGVIDLLDVSGQILIPDGAHVSGAGLLAGCAGSGTVVRNCAAAGSVTVGGETECASGGLAGLAAGSVLNCKCEVSLEGTSPAMGGAAGVLLRGGRMENLCILSKTPASGGGVLGSREEGSVLSGAYWQTDGGTLAVRETAGIEGIGDGMTGAQMTRITRASTDLEKRLERWIFLRASSDFVQWSKQNGQYPWLSSTRFSLTVTDGVKLSCLLESDPVKSSTAEDPFVITLGSSFELRSTKLSGELMGTEEPLILPAVEGHIRIVSGDPASPCTLTLKNDGQDTVFRPAGEGSSIHFENVVLTDPYCSKVIAASNGGMLSFDGVQMDGKLLADSGQMALRDFTLFSSLTVSGTVPAFRELFTVKAAEVSLSGKIVAAVEINGGQETIPAVSFTGEGGRFLWTGAPAEDCSIGFLGPMRYPAVISPDHPEWIVKDFYFTSTGKTAELFENAMVQGSASWADYAQFGAVEEEDGVFLIRRPEQLAWVSAQCAAGNAFGGKTVLLEGDLDLLEKRWTPIGPSASAAFSGTFDGNGHTLEGFLISETPGSNRSRFGLFGYLKNSQVRGFTLRGSVTVGSSGTYVGYTGAVAGTVQGSLIERVRVFADVTAAAYASGIAGSVTSGSGASVIDSCSFEGSILCNGSSSSSSAAGIVTLNQTELTIRNCTVKGAVTNICGTSGSVRTAGVLGYPNSAAVMNCAVNADVTACSGYVGGVSAGTAQSASIHNCVVLGKVGFREDAVSANSKPEESGVITAVSNGGGVPSLQNCYWEERNTDVIQPVPSSIANYCRNFASFDENGSGSFTVGSQKLTDLTAALNAWVEQNNSSALRYWIHPAGSPVFGRLFTELPSAELTEVLREEGMVIPIFTLSDAVPADGTAQVYAALYQGERLCSVSLHSVVMEDGEVRLTLTDLPGADYLKLFFLREDGSCVPLTASLGAEL